MAHIFSRRADRIANVVLGLLALAIVAVLLRLFGVIPPGAVAGAGATATGTGATVQPRDFSHFHHVSEIGIGCAYCHADAAKGPEAGYPPVETCAGCHLPVLRASAVLPPPLPWNRVVRVPDFVYFNHKAHVTRGIACDTCHGDVAVMERVVQPIAFTMQWCLSCHRDAAGHAGIDAYRLTNCHVCHR